MITTSIPVALSIAGSDSGGGAGIQADLKTFSALGVFGTTAITCTTAQNTRGVRDIHAIPPAHVGAQIEAVLCDFSVGAIKTGMLFSAAIINRVADVLAEQAQTIPLVIDPVMIATSGDALIEPDAVEAMRARLFPRATLITPNLDEAAVLTGQARATTEAQMIAQGEMLLRGGTKAVLIKGGHGEGDESRDVLVSASEHRVFSARRIATRNTHGTGCTLSAAIAAHLAAGAPLVEAVEGAKIYLSAAISAGAALTLGQGNGPVHHFHALWPKKHS